MLAKQHKGLKDGWVFPTEDGTLHKGSPLRKVLDAACDARGTKTGDVHWAPAHGQATCSGGSRMERQPHGSRPTKSDVIRRDV